MKDNFDTEMRRRLSEAEAEVEADLGFFRDPDATAPFTRWVETVTEPGIAWMRAVWAPNWRK